MIYITGDIHGEKMISKLSKKKWPQQTVLIKNDHLIITGDFGLIWSNPQTNSEKYWLDWLENKPFNILFIDGNHENFELLYEYPVEDFMGGKAARIRKNIWHLKRGEIFTIDNQRIFVFGGAQSHDKEHRSWGISWWPEEIPTYAEMDHGLQNLSKHNNAVDFIITHTLPYSIIHYQLNLYSRAEDPTAKFLEHIWNTVSFRHWYAGHFHMDWTYENKISILYDSIRKLY